MKNIVIIGSGFAGLSAACFLAKAGCNVTVLEKNSQHGGRARSFTMNGFTYDMGPSWYWMPDVFETFYNKFGYTTADFYELKRLDPSYQVIWQDENVSVPANYSELKQLFEKYEPGSGNRLDAFMKEAAYKYEASMKHLVYKPGLSAWEYMRWDVLKSAFRIDLLQSMHRHVRQYFSHPKLLQLAEFPILFLGALPENTPALYSLMNYADMKLGTWYPMGGMVKIADAMHHIATELGVAFRFGEAASEVVIENDSTKHIITEHGRYTADAVVMACDYHHAEQLLPVAYRNYDEAYWSSRSMAPSCMLFYLGFDKRINNLLHHNLFFDAPFDQHAAALYANPQWPEDPLMYICCPSKTDPSVAPEGSENIFALIPVAPGLGNDGSIREAYYEKVIRKLEKHSGQSLANAVAYKRSYAHAEFQNDYNAYKGNAYGLANTLMQTAFLKPSVRNKKLPNLFYTGQLTVPGPGVPPALISGEIVAKQVQTLFKKKMLAV